VNTRANPDSDQNPEQEKSQNPNDDWTTPQLLPCIENDGLAVHCSRFAFHSRYGSVVHFVFAWHRSVSFCVLRVLRLLFMLPLDSGVFAFAAMQHGEDRGNEYQGGDSGAKQAANHSSSQRSILFTPVA